MSKDSVENKLDILIFLLENLPSKIADEMEKRHELRKKMRIDEEMEFYTSNGDEIAKLATEYTPLEITYFRRLVKLFSMNLIKSLRNLTLIIIIKLIPLKR